MEKENKSDKTTPPPKFPYGKYLKYIDKNRVWQDRDAYKSIRKKIS